MADAHRFQTPVLEIGSRMTAGQESLSLRAAVELAGFRHTGLDLSPGPGVDVVDDAETCEKIGDSTQGTVICLDTLEHVRHPWKLCSAVHRILRPGGWFFLTSHMNWVEHNYPCDYWRFTPRGLQALLEDSGFIDIYVTHCEKDGFTQEIVTTFPDGSKSTSINPAVVRASCRKRE